MYYHNRLFLFLQGTHVDTQRIMTQLTKVLNGTIHISHEHDLRTTELSPLLDREAWKVSDELDYHNETETIDDSYIMITAISKNMVPFLSYRFDG